jgi:streptogramin lyase
MDELTTATYPVECGYGISVDSQGNIWTGGTGGASGNCVSKFDPTSCEAEVLDVPTADYLRGIAVGSGKSEGTVWAADTSGRLYAIDEHDMQLVGTWMLSAPSMIGVAIDGEGFVWTVSYEANAAFKFDPDSGNHHSITIGQAPYTYSDMTGVQLTNAVIAE